MTQITQLSLALLAVIALSASAAIASTDGAGQTLISAASDTNATTSPDQSKTLQGGVRTVDMEAADCLRQMGDASKKMQRAMLELMAEATRQAFIGVGDPDVIGTLIVPALPDSILATGPYLPMRKNWVDYYLNQVGSLIPIYAEYVDSLVMPKELQGQADQLLEQMRPLFLDAKQKYLILHDMSKHLKKVKNSKVAIYAVQIHDDFQKIDSIRLQVFALLKGSEKHDSKN